MASAKHFFMSQIPTYKPEHFINRELSWLEFNTRVLEEAQDASNPLLDRLKFLAIFSSNLDEFFMVRVAGLREQAFGGVVAQDKTPDDMAPIEQLLQISQRTKQLISDQCACWNEDILPSLAKEGIRILQVDELNKKQSKLVSDFFQKRAFPILTPMAIDPSHPSPRFHNRGVYLAASLQRVSGLGPADLSAVVQLPQVLPRFVPVGEPGETTFVLLEDVLASKLPELFGGYKIARHTTFRITRDMDVDLLDEEGDDMLRAIETRLRERQHSEAVRLEVEKGVASNLLAMITGQEKLHQDIPVEGQMYDEIYPVDALLDMTSLWELVRLPGKADLREAPFVARIPLGLHLGEDLFAEIADHDILLHHPFDSFDPVVQFVQQAADDPHVLAIKQTLYRTSGDSPIVRALIQAAENGKHVTALVELKARFDEANNISWSRIMERAGVHVVYGFMDLKTHSKLSMVVRQENNKVRRYVHLSTGNYNPSTAALYTDTGLFTSDKLMADDATALFNFLTGYSQGHKWEKLVVAPQKLHQRTLELIDAQAERAREGKSSRIFAKLNSLVDRRTIEALYRASEAGTQIDLVVRGICSLRPGLPGISENIRVRSIVDRFLEHSRIFVFGEGSKSEVYMTSADWMPRNFERRVEVMFPIEDPQLCKRVIEEIIPAYLRDNSKARELMPDGSYQRAKPKGKEPEYRAQRDLLLNATLGNSSQAGHTNGQLSDKSKKRSKRKPARKSR
ncbi:Polyphosphate kinase [Adhaeretor mobilis]|uniref:Polyphosphate kinase n=2 Tax=Adhaeretor mobilis TaxID=1930276 RepID=A0A517MSM2_9BACT|nr:Polyphosphate kinase [Adhaeretor mobilis]